MAHTFRPNKVESVRSIPADEIDRKKVSEDFRERKANQDKIKDERFAKIEARRKAVRDGKGRGINIKVSGDD